MTSRRPLRAPFPWFGGKSLAAPLVWAAFGDVPNFVEPFAGSLAVLLARPRPGKVETANDKDGLIANFWRAVAAHPDEVARWADWPVNEADLHARHRWLVESVPSLLERLIADPEYCDPQIAGWWVWGISAWVGSGWCRPGRGGRLWRQLPKVGGPGHGIHAPHRRKPRTDRNHGIFVRDVPATFAALAERLRHVRVCCGDWSRVLGRSTLGLEVDHGTTPCGVFLDPPYAHDGRDLRLYREDSDASLSSRVRAWAIEHGDNPALRIALCGRAGEHDMPAGWTAVAWGAASSSQSRARERIWFSRHCLRVGQPDLFGAS